MPGKAKSITRKTRETTRLRELIVLKAVQLYDASQADPLVVKKLGYRPATTQAEDDVFRSHGIHLHVGWGTVRNRHQELTESRANASFNRNSHMSREQEEALVAYIMELANRGFPLTTKRINECAEHIMRAVQPDFECVGENWSERFVDRHWEKLHVYWSRPLESVRGQAVNPITIEKFFSLLQSECEKHEFTPQNIYGGDESGLMSGVAQKERVVGGKGKKVQHQKREVNRQNTTVICTICADGSSLPPIVIFKGKHYQVRWDQENPLGCSIGYLEKGWTNNKIGLAWIQDFDRRTRDKAMGLFRLLLVDGHISHYSLELLEYAIENDIVIICYPSHTTHVLQGLDVAVFGAFKTYWGQETLDFERRTGSKVAKENFLLPFANAYIRAFTEPTIRAAFSKTGIYPFKPSVITADMMAPSKETSIQSHLPLEMSSPLRRISQGVAFRHVIDPADTEMSSPALIPVFYAPTKTRSVPIDPSILAAAEVSAAIAESDIRFLTSSSPIRSSESLPTLDFTQIHPPPSYIDRLLTEEPESQQAVELQLALQQSHEREHQGRDALTLERTRLVLVDLHLGRIKKQLYTKEEKDKNKRKKQRLLGDGLPHVLTSDEFVRCSKEHRDAADRAELDKSACADERLKLAQLKASWAEEQAKVKEMNDDMLKAFAEDLARWELERDEAKANHRTAPRLKPKKPAKIPAVPKPWVKSRVNRDAGGVPGGAEVPEDAEMGPDDEDESTTDDSEEER